LKTNFVLVDFENIQPKNLDLLKGGPFKIKVFLGANQAKLPVEMVRAVQIFGSDAEYITIDGSGRNALDFHIAYYIGRLAAENPGAHLHVISKDKGFDPLIKHLKAQKVSCQRSASITDIPRVHIASAKSSRDKVDVVVANLEKRKSAKPKTLKKLRSTIKSDLKSELADEELDDIIKTLTERGVLTITDGKVSYAVA
jgi:hypothetical protein